MGLPALVLSESLMGELEGLLLAESIDVEWCDLTVPDVPTAKLLKYELQCSRKEGDKVILRFARDETFDDKVLVALYVDKSADWMFWKQNPLLVKIEKILRDHGAIDLADMEG